MAGSSGRPERAALLLGASATLSTELGVSPLFPYWDVHHGVCKEAVRASLGEAQYRRCWERGHALRWDQVTAAALEEATAGDPPARRLKMRPMRVS